MGTALCLCEGRTDKTEPALTILPFITMGDHGGRSRYRGGVMVEREGADKGGFCYRETEPVEDMACIMVYGP